MEQATSDKKFGGGKVVTKGASQLRSTEPVSFKQGFYKVTPLPGRREAVVGDENVAAPAGMAEATVPSSPTIVLPPTEAPAKKTELPANPALNFQTDTFAAGDRRDGTTDARLYRNLGVAGKDISGSVASPAVPGSAGEVDKSGHMELALNGTATTTGRTTFAVRKPGSGAALDSFQKELGKKDAGVQYNISLTNGAVGQKAEDAAPTLVVNEKVLRQALVELDKPLPQAPSPAPIPQPEILTSENAFSTFSLN